MSCSWIGSLMSSRRGRGGTPPVVFSGFRPSQSGTPRPRAVSTLERISGFLRLASLMATPCPAFTWKDGMVILRSSTCTCPWRMGWGAWARGGAGGGEAEAVDHVVQPPLELHQEVLAGDPLAAVGLDEIVAELRLEHSVDALDLLLLAELQAVAERPPAT